MQYYLPTRCRKKLPAEESILKKRIVFVFWGAVACIALAFSLLVVFRLLQISCTAAAYTTASLAVLGGMMLIGSCFRLLSKKDLPIKWSKKLRFLFPDLIVLGLIFIVLAAMLFIGKTL